MQIREITYVENKHLILSVDAWLRLDVCISAAIDTIMLQSLTHANI